jgi:hypothetical protein
MQVTIHDRSVRVAGNEGWAFYLGWGTILVMI